jgi:hypothetical protein
VGDNALAVLAGPSTGAPSASVSVTIEDSNIDNLVLTLTPPQVITGQIKVEGQLPENAALDPLRVSLTPAANSAQQATSATAAADGTFKINLASEGEFRVTVSALPAGFYLKEARFDNVDVLNGPSRFSASGNLAILISGHAGEVSGRVVNDQTKSIPEIEAVLVPNESRGRPELFKRAVTNKDGQFRIIGIPPGDYRVFSWERIEPYSFFDEDVLRKFEPQGTPVHVAESSRETIEVKLIPETMP